MRCQATKVLALTRVKASRQLNQRLSSTSVRRVGLSARRGWTLRSCCSRRNKVSAASEVFGRQQSPRKWTISPKIRSRLWPVLIMNGLIGSPVDVHALKIATTLRGSSPREKVFAEHRTSLSSEGAQKRELHIQDWHLTRNRSKPIEGAPGTASGGPQPASFNSLAELTSTLLKPVQRRSTSSTPRLASTSRQGRFSWSLTNTQTARALFAA